MDNRPDVVVSGGMETSTEQMRVTAALQNPIIQYDIKTHDQPFVIIQHDPSAKVAITEIFNDAGHDIFQTDLNYTGMVWSDQSIMSLLNFENNKEIHFVFLPFQCRRWPHHIPSNLTKTDALATDILYYNKYIPAIIEKFKNRDLFGHLNLSRLIIGVRVHCFWRSGINTAQNVRDKLGWILQFEANRNGLLWRVKKYESRETCDVTLVVSISQKCCFFGIEVRRPITKLPFEVQMEGIMYIWTFLHVADTIKVVNYNQDGQDTIICLLTYKNALAAFWNAQNPPKSENRQEVATSDISFNPLSKICWAPLRWEMSKINHLLHDHIPSQPNPEVSVWMDSMQKFIRLALHGGQPGTGGLPPVEWIG